MTGAACGVVEQLLPAGQAPVGDGDRERRHQLVTVQPGAAVGALLQNRPRSTAGPYRWCGGSGPGLGPGPRTARYSGCRSRLSWALPPSAREPGASDIGHSHGHSVAAASVSERCAAAARRRCGGRRAPTERPRGAGSIWVRLSTPCCWLDLGPENYRKISTGELTTGGGRNRGPDLRKQRGLCTYYALLSAPIQRAPSGPNTEPTSDK